MKLTINSTCETKIDADAQGSMMILRTIACRFFLLVVLLLMAVGVKAQAQLLDGVYTINNATGQRGTMCFGAYGGSEYFGMSDIELDGHEEKSVEVSSDSNKYWYVTTRNGKTFIYNIGKGLFLQKHERESATCGACDGGFNLPR